MSHEKRVGDLIDAVRTRLRRNRFALLGLYALLVFSTLIGALRIVTRFGPLGGLGIIAALAIFLLFVRRKKLSLELPPQPEEAATILDERLQTRSRFSAFESAAIAGVPLAAAKRTLLVQQLAPFFESSPSIGSLAPFPRPLLLRSGVGLAILLWLPSLYEFVQPKPIHPLARQLEKVLAENPELPPQVEEAFEKLAAILEAESFSSETQAALDHARAELESAQSELEASAESAEEVIEPTEETGALDAMAPPTPTPSPTPTPTSAQSAANPPEQNPPQQDKQNQEKKSEQAQQQEGGQGGNSDQQKESQDSKKGKEKGSSDSDDQSQEESKEKGKGKGSSQDDSGKGEGKDESPSKEKGAGQGQSDQQKSLDNASEALDQVEKQLGTSGTAPQNNEKPDQKQPQSGESGEKKDQNQNNKEDQKEGQKEKGDSKGTQDGKNGAGSEPKGEPDDKKQGDGDGKGDKPSSQKPDPKTGKSGEDPGKEKGEEKGPTGAGSGDKAGQPQPPKPPEDGKDPGEGSPSQGQKSPEGGPSSLEQRELGPEQGGMKGEKGFQEVEVKDADEKLDSRFTGKDEKRALNSEESRPKTQLSDVTLAKPQVLKDKGEQPMPLEYENLMR